MKLVLGLATLALSFTTYAFELPVGTFDALAIKTNIEAKADAPVFEGIVKLSNCSGSLIIFEGMPTNMKALVMTNGHCLSLPGGFLKPGEVLVNKSVNRSMRVYDAGMKLHNIRATRIVYGTMTNTDVAIYELDATYNQIHAASGVRPLLLSQNRPLTGVKIDIPSGYWDRNWSCEIDGFAFSLREGDWTFTDSIRYDENCDTIGGTSGSPIVQHGERTVIGINNTSNEDGGRCTLNNPCEVDEAGRVIVIRQRSYGQQTYEFYGCIDAQFKLDLALSSCTLPKPL